MTEIIGINKYNYLFKKICSETAQKNDVLPILIIPGYIYLQYNNKTQEITKTTRKFLVNYVIIKDEQIEYNDFIFNKERLELLKDFIDKLSLEIFYKFCTNDIECVQCHSKYNYAMTCSTCGLIYDSANSKQIQKIFSEWPYQYDYIYSTESKEMLANDIIKTRDWIKYYELLYINTDILASVIKNLKSTNKKLLGNNTDIKLLNSMTDDIIEEHSDEIKTVINNNYFIKLMRYSLYLVSLIAFIFSLRITWDFELSKVVEIFKNAIWPIILMIVGIILLKRKNFLHNKKQNMLIMAIISIIIYNFFLLDKSSSKFSYWIIIIMFCIIILILFYISYQNWEHNKLYSGMTIAIFMIILVLLILWAINTNPDDDNNMITLNLWFGFALMLIITGLFMKFFIGFIYYTSDRNAKKHFWKTFLTKTKEDKIIIVSLILIITPSLAMASSNWLKTAGILLSGPFVAMLLPGYKLLAYDDNSIKDGNIIKTKKLQPEVFKPFDLETLQTNIYNIAQLEK